MKKTFILLSSAMLLTSSASFANPQNDDTIPIKRPNVFVDMGNFFDQMNRNFFNDPMFKPGVTVSRAGMPSPKADVYENKDDIIVKIDLPGIEKDKVKLEVFQDYVSLKYEEKTSKEEKTDTYHIAERSYGSFQRVIPIPNNGIIEDADSEYKDGVLTVTIPKSGDAKPRSKVLEI